MCFYIDDFKLNHLALSPNKLFSAIKLPKTNDVIADNLIKIFIEGPVVSFKGSPTVSPTTAATCNYFILIALS